jgi:hypothetical protein
VGGPTREGEDCPERPLATWRARPLLIWRVALPCYASAERGDWRVSVPLTHSEVIRVRDRPNIPKPCTVSDAEVNPTGLVDELIDIGRERQRIMEAMKAALLRGDDVVALEHARQLTGLPTKRSICPSTSTQAGR